MARDSLKGLIEELSGVAPEMQQLFCHGVRLGDSGSGDCETLKDFGVLHGHTVVVRTRRRSASDPGIRTRQQPMLACTAKRREAEESRGRQERQRVVRAQEGARRSGNSGASAKVADRQGCVSVMPKWQPPSGVNFFGNTHKGLDFHGDSRRPVHMFGDYHTWRPDEDDAAMMRIRARPAYTCPVAATEAS